MIEQKTVTISVDEYRELLEDREKLIILYIIGADYWNKYNLAMDGLDKHMEQICGEGDGSAKDNHYH